MADIGHLYDRDKVNKVFAISSVAFLLSVTWMIAADAKREWKDWQKAFNGMEIAVSEMKLKDAEFEAVKGGWEEAFDKREAARAEAEAEKGVRDELGKAIVGKRAELDRVMTQITVFAGQFDALRSAEELAAHEAGREPSEEPLKENLAKMAELTAQKESLERELASMRADLAAKDEKLKAAEAEFKRVTGRAELIQKKLDNIKPSLINTIRNMPLIDFLDPSLKIRQVVPPDLFVPNAFSQAPQVDRCVSCHLASDNPMYEFDRAAGAFKDENVEQYVQTATGGNKSKLEQWQKLFAAHPRLDLFVGAKSPHPVAKFGCVSCHVGNGLGTSFQWAAHTPSTRKQSVEWEKRHDWSFSHYEEYPMRPLWQTEASCKKCHMSEFRVKEAPVLSRGMRIIRNAGCYACHNMDQFAVQGFGKPGPSLVSIKDKLEPDWVKRWVMNPHALRPATPMPRIFGVAAVSDEEREAVERREAVEIEGIVAYLFGRSDEPAQSLPPAGSGNAERGKKLFESIGCQGCHVVGTPEAPVKRADRDPSAFNSFGPPLDGIGAKTSKAWVVKWIKDPKSLRPETRMPDLRVSDGDALDIAEYLMMMKTPAPSATALPAISPEEIQAVALALLEEKLTNQDAVTKNAAMSNDDRLVFIGEKAISRQGCFSCHTIKGFREEPYQDRNANAKYDATEPYTDENGNSRWDAEPLPIGADLSDWGRKNIHQIDFGMLHQLEHTRASWLSAKLSNPRGFDHGRIVEYKNRLRMPKFEFRSEDISYLVTAILGMSREELAQSRVRNLDLHEKAAEEGRRIVRARNCQGCHSLEGEGGEKLAEIVKSEFAPPPLDPVGARIQSEWLFPFLKSPTNTIRPNVAVRMPTFGFTDDMANRLIRMFAGISRIDQIFMTESERRKPEAEMVNAGNRLFMKADCLLCHSPSAPIETRAPDLGMAWGRLRSDWVSNWIANPPAMIPTTRMPAFWMTDEVTGNLLPLDSGVLDGDGRRQVDAVRDYVMSIGRP